MSGTREKIEVQNFIKIATIEEYVLVEKHLPLTRAHPDRTLRMDKSGATPHPQRERTSSIQIFFSLSLKVGKRDGIGAD